MKEELCEKVVEVRWVSDIVMAVVSGFEEDVLRLICGCASQSCDEFKGEWCVHSVDGIVMCFGFFDGHVCRHIIMGEEKKKTLC